jgi:DNA-binding MarR family transcriptional regulator
MNIRGSMINIKGSMMNIKGSMINKQRYKKYLVWFALYQIHERMSKHEEKLFRNTGLTQTEHRILMATAFFNENNEFPAKLSDLALYQNRSLVSISLIVDRMEKKRFVKRVRDPSDRRAINVLLTPRGKKILAETSNPSTKFLLKIFSTFSDTELEELMLLLNRLLAMVEAEIAIKKEKIFTNTLTLNQLINFLEKLNE